MYSGLSKPRLIVRPPLASGSDECGDSLTYPGLSSGSLLLSSSRGLSFSFIVFIPLAGRLATRALLTISCASLTIASRWAWSRKLSA